MGSGFTLIRSKHEDGVLKFYPIANDTGTINIGDGTLDCDLKIFLGSTTEYIEFDVGNSRMNVIAPLVMGTSTTDGVALTDAITVISGIYSEVGVALTASTVVQGTLNNLYISTAQDADVDIYAGKSIITTVVNLVDGEHVGLWGEFAFSGTVSTVWTAENINAGMKATLTSDNNLTLGTACVAAGLVIDSKIGSSATINGNTVGLHIKKGSTSLDFEYGIEWTDCLSTAVFKCLSSGTVVSDSDSGAVPTAEGYITCEVDGNVRYIYLFDAKPSG